MVKKTSKTELKPIKREIIKIELKGLTPLLMQKQSERVVQEIENIRIGKTIEKDRRPEIEKIDEKIHYTKEGNIGFPASGFAKGIRGVAQYFEGLNGTKVGGAIRVLGDIVPINYKKRETNKSIGPDSGRTRAPHWIIRPEFIDWYCTLEVEFDANIITPEQIVNLTNAAGFHRGIGSWRPEKGGTYGQYEVCPTKKKKKNI